MTVKIEMEMPKSCDTCSLLYWDSAYMQYMCPAFPKSLKFVGNYHNERHPACPLQEVKE